MSGRVLIRGVNWVGDSVMTIPALRALRGELKGSHFSLLVKPQVSAIFEKDPAIDEIILYKDEYKGLRGKFRIAKVLREREFTLSVLFQNAFDAALITALAGVPKRVGYSRDLRGVLLTNPVGFDDKAKRLHHIDYYIYMLRRAGLIKKEPPPEDKIPWIFLDLEERLRARNTLKGLKRPILGINPGAAYGSAKRWGARKFSEVAVNFMADFDGSVVVFGKEREEAEVAGIIQSACKCRTEHRVLSLAGKTTLRELISLIGECDIVLSNDSGPMHIAYALRKPLVAIFGSTEPSLTGPPPLGSKVIKHNIHCSPCFERECKEGTLACMNGIATEEVSSAIKDISPINKGVFFDRDGTLIKDVDYLRRWEDYEPLEGLDSLNRLKEKGFKLIGITNQSGIARGIIDEGFVKGVNELIMKEYGIDAFYYCPHHPDEKCPCRKPQPEMALRAALEHRIEPRKSFVLGDKDIDMLLAKAIGARGVLVLTGKERESQNADYIAKDLREAIDWIITQDR